MKQGCQGQEKMFEKFQVREKLRNFDLSQGNLEKLRKVKEMSGNSKIFLQLFHL